jgi:mono/diheme cytochrome c family protein
VPDKPIPEDDPVVSRSFAPHYVVAMLILMVTLFWALWDEDFGQRPWKAFQNEWKDRYSAFLKNARAQSSTAQTEIQATSDYQALKKSYDDASQQAAPRIKEINEKLRDLSGKILAVQNSFTDRRAYVNAATYAIETETSASSKESKQKALKEYESQPSTVEMPDGSKRIFKTFDDLEQTYNELKNQRTQLSAELGELLKPLNEKKELMDSYLADHMVSLTPSQLANLQNGVEAWTPRIRQINVNEHSASLEREDSAQIVDRCESCHMGIREPVKLTAASMSLKGKKPDEYARAFTSHPEPDLLKTHDPDKFGCSPCHQGNGRATTSVEKAHGTYEHWLWPLFPRQNMEAGCQICHSADMMLSIGEVGSVISFGKDLYRQRGCVGCHRYEGYDREPEDLLSIAQEIKLLEQQKVDNLKEANDLMKQADAAETNAEANRLNDRAVALKVTNSKVDLRIVQLDRTTKSLLQDIKKVGPNLKDVRLKLNKNWIPVWLKKPTDFRATTRMPNFRLTDDQVQAISAYLWQSALTDPPVKHKPGNAAHGKELFETRGCLGCHSIGEGDQMQGGGFAANLTRVGEKDNYDYLVRWVHNARERTRPYCMYEKKDIGPEDYAKKGLPFVFDLDHSRCPNDGHELQVQNMTVMPSLRLSPEDAEDVASYLITLKKKEASSYPDAPFMDDPNLKAEGKKLIQFFGCAGCHEIAGLEDEGRIGTELTFEGSKPIDRLDFALLTDVAERGGREPIADPEDLARLPEGPAKAPWHDHKGFFEHKLAEPNVWDQGKIFTDETEKLRMPNLHLDKNEIQALTTFLMGSQENVLPDSYQYRPLDYHRDIQEGWWVIKKYNCVGCHQLIPGQKTALMGVARYQGPGQEQLPPKLLTEGARVDPQWLLRFLKNPALNDKDTNRNGVRFYLQVRMPTFSFSENELGKLVRFFQALSQQPFPYIPELEPQLTAKETEMARSLFSSSAAPCLKCHATGDPVHDRTATAPNFLLAKDRLKPDWVERWIIDPQAISPGTSMPSGLFKREDGRWVFSGPTPPSFKGYDKDQTKLLVDYIFQLTAEEQRRVSAAMGHASASTGGSSSGGKAASGVSSGNGVAQNRGTEVAPGARRP